MECFLSNLRNNETLEETWVFLSLGEGVYALWNRSAQFSLTRDAQNAARQNANANAAFKTQNQNANPKRRLCSGHSPKRNSKRTQTSKTQTQTQESGPNAETGPRNADPDSKTQSVSETVPKTQNSERKTQNAERRKRKRKTQTLS